MHFIIVNSDVEFTKSWCKENSKQQQQQTNCTLHAIVCDAVQVALFIGFCIKWVETTEKHHSWCMSVCWTNACIQLRDCVVCVVGVIHQSTIVSLSLFFCHYRFCSAPQFGSVATARFGTTVAKTPIYNNKNNSICHTVLPYTKQWTQNEENVIE